jgi:hypothetical protein
LELGLLLFDCLAFLGCARYVKPRGLESMKFKQVKNWTCSKAVTKKIMNFPDPNNYLTESFVCTWNILRSLLSPFINLVWWYLCFFSPDSVHCWYVGVRVG